MAYTISRQSAAKPLSEKSYEERSTTIPVMGSTPGYDQGETVESKVKIYTLSDPLTGHIRYVGKTIQSLNKRLNGHLYKNAKTYTISWIKSLKKQGVTPIIETIDIVPNSEWKFWEKYYICLFKSWGYKLTNHSDGGEGRENVQLTQEQKDYLSNLWKGKQFSQEHYIKMREGLVNYYKERRNKKLNKYQQPKPVKEKYIHTESHRENLRKALSGRKLPAEVCQKMAISRMKTVIQMNKNGQIIKEWDSVKEAAAHLKIDRSIISHHIRGKKKSAGGYLWMYKELT